MTARSSLPVARPLFVATILCASFLLFLVQPMVARMALPHFGGAPNVWNSAMLVYQALLLAGYAYAHRLSKLPFKRQARLHIALFVVFAISLPVSLYSLPLPAPGWEVLWVPLLLLLTVGPVFFIVSAQAPLMQRWFASHPSAGEPWALYAASNLGSFAGLIAYPLLAEPLLAIEAQSIAWSAGYAVLLLLVVLSARARWREPDGVAVPAEQEEGETVSRKRILLWIVLSAIPSGMMLSTTTHLTTDIFAMPLLWVIPLGIYLLSFVVAFADNRVFAWAITLFAPSLMLLGGGLTMISRNSGDLTLALASVALLFTVAVSLHSRLYDLRPHASQLTLFYFAMSVGGALGGAFTAIAAPVLFDWVWEHPILTFAAAIVMPLPALLNWRNTPGLEPEQARFAAAIMLALACFVAWMLFGVAGEKEPGIHRVFLTIMLCGIGLMLVSWRWLFLTVLAMLMVFQGGYETVEASWKGERTRSYFGVYTVLDYPTHQLRMLVHGTTLHGEQSTDPEKLREPRTYYGSGSGAAIALEAAPQLLGQGARIGVVGLGTGTLACYRQPGQSWTFFEIDPVVLDFSRDGTFTFLDQCAPKARIILGDARLKLERMQAGTFDMLVIDAFSSDAIPLHLLTDEALGVYMRALSSDGLLAIHISNRYIELEPVLAAIAERQGLSARLRFNDPGDDETFTPSVWVVLSRDPARLSQLAETQPDAPWEDLGKPADRVWTDDYASILPYIHWRRLLGDL